jgi:hypothetical protein
MANERGKDIDTITSEKRIQRIGMATASLVAGIIGISFIPLSFILFFKTRWNGIPLFYLSPILLVSAIVIAILSIRQAGKLQIKTPRGAKVGLALGMTGIISDVAIGIAWFSYWMNF